VGELYGQTSAVYAWKTWRSVILIFLGRARIRFALFRGACQILCGILEDSQSVVFGDGEQTRDFTTSTMRFSQSAGLRGAQCFRKGFQRRRGRTGFPQSVLRELGKITGKKLEQSTNRARWNIRDSQADISQAQEFLGYQPNVTFEKAWRGPSNGIGDAGEGGEDGEVMVMTGDAPGNAAFAQSVPGQ